MTIRSDGRRLIQLTMKPDLYERIREHCNSIDTPMTIWARQIICRELDGVGARGRGDT
jgi:hypothetical protein